MSKTATDEFAPSASWRTVLGRHIGADPEVVFHVTLTGNERGEKAVTTAGRAEDQTPSWMKSLPGEKTVRNFLVDTSKPGEVSEMISLCPKCLDPIKAQRFSVALARLYARTMRGQVWREEWEQREQIGAGA